MLRPPALAFALCALLLGGCTRRSTLVADVVATIAGYSGWFRVTPGITIDPAGKLAPRLTDEQERAYREEDADETDPSELRLRRAERVKDAYRAQFSSVYLEAQSEGESSGGCANLVGGGAPPGPVFILVHGVQGDGVEWWPVVPTLAQANPAAMYMYKWLPHAERGKIIDGLVRGINRIAECYPDARLVLLAHSAGGVISSFAASRVKLNPHATGQRLEILTVASPLAGVGYRQREDDTDETRLINDLGTSQTGYPAAAPGVTVTHFRTQFPADTVMKPNVFGHAPNQKGVGVLGAREIDLPAHLGHDPSLLYVAKELVAGRAPSPSEQ